MGSSSGAAKHLRLPLVGLRLTRELQQRAWRWLSRLPWGRRILALGAVLILVMVAAHSMSNIWHKSIDAAGFLIYFGIIVATGFPRIKNIKDRATRIAFRWAFAPFAAGAVLIPAGLLIFVYDHPLGANLEVGGTLLLVASVLLFGLASG